MSTEPIPNMETFARVSGISRPTVSKYFHDPASVRKSTRAKIEEALERYDYRPNVHAINQNRRFTKTIGIVVPYLADPFFAEMARHIERLCLEAGFSPLLFSSHGSAALEMEVLDHLRSLRAAGVLLAPLGRGSDRSALERFCAHVPTVLFDANIEGVGEAFVGSDNFQSVPMLVDHLCASGPPPCFFEMPPVNPNANKRRAAYRDAMVRRGHEPMVVARPRNGMGLRIRRGRGRAASHLGAPVRHRDGPVLERPAGHRPAIGRLFKRPAGRTRPRLRHADRRP